MKSILFEPPVRIAFAPSEKIIDIVSAHDASHCMMDTRWKVHGNASAEAAAALVAALHGRVTAESARLAFVAAAKEAGLYVQLDQG